jgi:hypothetical protein
MSKEIDAKIDELIEESGKAETSPKRKTEIFLEVKKLITQNLAEGPELSEMKERADHLDKRSRSPVPDDRSSAQIKEANKLQSEYRKDLKKIADKANRIRPQQMFETSWRKTAGAESKEENKENVRVNKRNNGPK